MVSSWKDEFSVTEVLGFRGGRQQGMVRDEIIETGWSRCCGSFMFFLIFVLQAVGSCERCLEGGKGRDVQILLRKINWW